MIVKKIKIIEGILEDKRRGVMKNHVRGAR